ncbi:tRNA (adenosine(37)-N6)-threonylcarbamoyltransferase complex ATPase subunit type 1 TsaE [Anaerofustis stercorihominis]|uniref:tRNA (adenosine(37)-N6)-threonylcarbamoyltransferase complex ATPase subunit type 1 TsaE n=1 Tax=Anaerofustis stercorihominis TaxID=214853 RepID=UPI00214C0249|nr:tRNA (adenosine(37)-N6)-threonylcarbamoyltransferase complex ATPase subunit type 1 TsaE [Anaerofustis stercorihominis]MCR2032204.1 tRNA (adenosine(37)-N6)-threonylcarbamoyltransferase complex ATPase subunit type 1 TsaE [Anaerofustis stercorihominis]
MRIITRNDMETTSLGKEIGKLLKNNTSVYLIGEMASGKTQLSKGIAESLGLLNKFSSPTYTIINEYKNEFDTLYHMDAYRIEDISELDYIGFYDIYKNEKMIIEWADMIMSELDETGIIVDINKDEQDFNKRVIDIKAFDDSIDIMKKLEEIYE